MTEITVRRIYDNEMLEILHRANTYAFSPSPPLRDRVEWNEIVSARKGVDYFALFEDEKAVSNAATTRLTQNIRGKIFPGGGVWGVATLPEARRKGYCRKVMAKLLESERDAGRVVSLLYPFRGSFYERLGYTTFPQPRKALFKPEALAGLLKRPIAGEITLQPIAEAYDDYLSFLELEKKRIHGFACFDFDNRARFEQLNNWWLAQAVFDGKVEGIMLYDLRGDEIMKFKLRACRFYYTRSRARYRMLEWISRHIDQAGEVELWLAPSEQPETWLADIRPDLEPVFFAPMGRIVDVSGLGGMPAGPAAFTANIRDSLCPWNNGSWLFDGRSGELVVSRANHGDLDLEIQALNAIVYGTHDPDDFEALGWGSVRREWSETVLALFSRQMPFIHEMF